MPYEVYLNGSESTLNGAINSLVTTFVVTDGSQYASGDGGIWHAILDDQAGTTELITVDGTQRSGNTLNGVVRGVEGTTATSFISGSKLTAILTAESLGHVVQVKDEGTIVGNVRVLNAVGAGVTATVSSGVGVLTIPGPGAQNIDVLFQFDGGGSALDTSFQEILAFDYAEGCTITGIEIYADLSGSITLDLQKFTYSTYGSPTSICAGTKPTFASAPKYLDSTLTGWSTSLAVGDRLAVKVTNAGSATITKLWGFLKVQRGGNGINSAVGTFVVQNNGSAIAQRSILNFTSNLSATDDSGNDRINLSFTPPVITSYILIRDQKAAGSNGGTFTSGAWRTRDLNTEVVDVGNYASVASNQFTLLAGTYRVRISVPANYVQRHKARLRNITDSSTTSVGTTEYTTAADTNITTTRSLIIDRFTISGTKVFEVQHQCNVSRSSDGFGETTNFGEIEIYTVVELERE